MGILHKPDGRWLVGLGVENGNEYAGSMGYRDIVIQLTASGATDKSMEYLAFLLDYAVSHYAVGEPIAPPNVSVYISANGYVKAVQADDYSTNGTNFEVGGIKWNGSAWDFSNAGQGGSGGGGGSGALVNIGVTVDEQGEVVTLQKTGQEILDYVSAGLIPYIDFDYTVEEISFRSTALLMSYSAEPGSSATTTHTFYFGQRFLCDALSDYPVANL